MILSFLILPLLLSISFAYSIHSEDYSFLWGAWKSIHAKTYMRGEEEGRRFSIFKENYNKILRFNAENNGVKFALNKVETLTTEEFSQIYLGHIHLEEDQKLIEAQTIEFPLQDPSPLPISVDWRQKKIVTPVKDQSRCGACWAFSAVAALESFNAIKTSQLKSFSEQQIIDCDDQSYGCGGGLTHNAFIYAAKNGLQSERDYPYVAHDQKCRYNQSKTSQVNGNFSFIPPKNVTILKAAVITQPVSVAIDADQDLFQFYSSGVIGGNCHDKLNHAVLVVGYDVINGKEAWIAKNSWSSAWGNAGYVYISTSERANHGAGVCGILSQPVIPN